MLSSNENGIAKTPLNRNIIPNVGAPLFTKSMVTCDAALLTTSSEMPHVGLVRKHDIFLVSKEKGTAFFSFLV